MLVAVDGGAVYGFELSVWFLPEQALQHAFLGFIFVLVFVFLPFWLLFLLHPRLLLIFLSVVSAIQPGAQSEVTAGGHGLLTRSGACVIIHWSEKIKATRSGS